MSHEQEVWSINKNNIDLLLKELGKEIQHIIGRKNKLEILIVGGGSIILNYNFRDSTTDLDTWCVSANLLKEAAIKVSDRSGYPIDWINSDFTSTNSFSSKLFEHSKYYKTFYSLEVRTISDEQLLAMKLMSFRWYKHDISDIIGIVNDMNKQNKIINLNMIENAYKELYDKDLENDKKKFLNLLFLSKNLELFHTEISKKESNNSNLLIKFENDYPNVLKEKNVNSILESIDLSEDFNIDLIQNEYEEFEL